MSLPRGSLSTFVAGALGGALALLLHSLLFEKDALPRIGDDATGQAMSRVSREIAELRRQLGEISAALSHEPQRIAVDREAVAGQPDGTDLQSQIARLEQLVLRMESSRSGTDVSALVQARRQHPNPNIVAVRSLWQSLESSPKNEEYKRARDWLLLGMEDIVRLLGTPSNVIWRRDQPNSQSWEYFLSDSEALIVEFVDGLVTSVDT